MHTPAVLQPGLEALSTGSLVGRRAQLLPRLQSSLLSSRAREARLHRLQQGRRHLAVRPAASSSGTQQAPTQAARVEQAAAGWQVVQLYRQPGLPQQAVARLISQANSRAGCNLTGIETELCFNVALKEALTPQEEAQLHWLLRETYEPDQLSPHSWLAARLDGANGNGKAQSILEVGPRLNYSSAWSTNAVAICGACGLAKVARLEVSRRFLLAAPAPLPPASLAALAALVHDRMTEQVYQEPLRSFAASTAPSPVYTIPLLAQGRAALEHINDELGLAFDERDLDYYTNLFQMELKRDPTNVEMFDIAQSNSEHSRHWFFGGELTVDGQAAPETLMQIVKSTLKANPTNSVIGFKDNSSAIRGTVVTPLLPRQPGQPGPLAPQQRDWDVLLTAETHNFPCAVAPMPGAETGAGGRIRDTHATGIGSIMGAATAGYCVGNLGLEGYELPWEDPDFQYPASLASPLQILIEASNGASDYGNKFGEPLIAGYTRTFGMRLPDGERREWIKPIMFSGGLGQIDHRHLEKEPPEVGMLIVKIGGPAYRIGMGGGAASSVPSGSNKADLDFDAVQRGDAEMSQKLWRVVRACVELGEANPLQQIHDQGAGGNCNVVKEICYPLGGQVDVRKVKLGDETMSVLEIWGAEYQENDCVLIKPEDRDHLQAICDRERCLMQVIGSITGSGRIVVTDSAAPAGQPDPAVDLPLELVLGDMPRKSYSFQRAARARSPLALPEGLTAEAALDRVLRLPSVASKRFLTSKVDRCVTGLVAQQQCCGPLQLPVADVAVMAQSHYNLTGAATAIGEQPLKGLVDPAAMARLALGEALTNLMWAAATDLSHVKASVNWMYAAKMGSEGADMYDAALALREAMVALRVAVDGGKDSLSMAAAAGGETVMAPGNLVVSAYVTCPDITLTVTPDLKLPGSGRLLHVDLAAGRRRLGGSALAQAYNQVGDEVPDMEPAALAAAWRVTQGLLRERKLSAGHDISDGGLAAALLEMAFAGNCGVQADLGAGPALPALFAEELGLLLEVAPQHQAEVLAAYSDAGLAVRAIGHTLADSSVSITVDGQPAVSGTVAEWRDVWEATGFQLERLQRAPAVVDQEQAGLAARSAPTWHLPYSPTATPPEVMAASDKVRVAVVREEGSNGDREMSAAVHQAGMEPWDVTMSDLLEGRISLDSFRGVIFVGGFSYADVLDSAKGWAGTIRGNRQLAQQFDAFYNRPDTFSLGVCNGCQLMALLGWVPATAAATSAGDQEAASSAAARLPDLEQPRFVHNESGRFECRWVTVSIQEDTPAVMLAGMGGARMGVWCAHGEGRAVFPSAAVQQQVLADGLAPVRYCGAEGSPTEQYPFNPNGSPAGIAALCSPDGRHLAMMPHPERCFLAWQAPWAPAGLGLDSAGPGPWLRLFQNARAWAEQTAAKK